MCEPGFARYQPFHIFCTPIHQILGVGIPAGYGGIRLEKDMSRPEYQF